VLQCRDAGWFASGGSFAVTGPTRRPTRPTSSRSPARPLRSAGWRRGRRSPRRPPRVGVSRRRPEPKRVEFPEPPRPEVRGMLLPRARVHKARGVTYSSCPVCLRAAFLAPGSVSGRSHKEVWAGWRGTAAIPHPTSISANSRPPLAVQCATAAPAREGDGAAMTRILIGEEASSVCAASRRSDRRGYAERDWSVCPVTP
jgi:hypothetical protein